jgi:hypothetical protein
LTVAVLLRLFAAFVLLPVAGLPDLADAAQPARVFSLRSQGFSPSKVAVSECASSAAPNPEQRQSRPQGLLVVLHGRGGADGVAGLLESFQPSLCRHKLIAAAPAAPTANRNWPFETKNGEGQEQYLLNFIRSDVFKFFGGSYAKHPLPVYLVGISAGATFLMGDFYPLHGHKLRGRALALCGGSWPVRGTINGVKTIESTFPLFVQIGKTDFLLNQVTAGLTKYSQAGLPLRARFTDAAGHCAFDFNEAVDHVLAEAK